MGQAFRRATGKLKISGTNPSTPTPPPPPPRPPTVPPQSQHHVKNVERRSTSMVHRLDDAQELENLSRGHNNDNVLEERDPGYDSMLNKMVGRISTKPGGKLEMGEAFIVEKYNRPLPKLRSSKVEVDVNGQKAHPPGTLDVTQLKQILLLHEGKSDDYQGSMDADSIANKFRIDVVQVQKILQHVSLPPEGNKKNTTNSNV